MSIKNKTISLNKYNYLFCIYILVGLFLFKALNILLNGYLFIFEWELSLFFGGFLVGRFFAKQNDRFPTAKEKKEIALFATVFWLIVYSIMINFAGVGFYAFSYDEPLISNISVMIFILILVGLLLANFFLIKFMLKFGAKSKLSLNDNIQGTET